MRTARSALTGVRHATLGCRISCHGDALESAEGGCAHTLTGRRNPTPARRLLETQADGASRPCCKSARCVACYGAWRRAAVHAVGHSTAPLLPCKRIHLPMLGSHAAPGKQSTSRTSAVRAADEDVTMSAAALPGAAGTPGCYSGHRESPQLLLRRGGLKGTGAGLRSGRHALPSRGHRRVLATADPPSRGLRSPLACRLLPPTSSTTDLTAGHSAQARPPRQL